MSQILKNLVNSGHTVQSWPKESLETATKHNRGQKRDKTPQGFWSFQGHTQCWSSLPLVKLPEAEMLGFTPSVWRLCHTVFGFTRQGQLHKELNCCLSNIQELAVVYWSSFKKCRWERTCRAPLETPISKHYFPAKPESICEPQASQ